MTNNQKSASVWLAYLDGWYGKFGFNGDIGIRKPYIKLPMATNRIRAKCVKMYDELEKEEARKLAFEMGFEGILF